MIRRKTFNLPRAPRACAVLATMLALGFAAPASAQPTDWLEYTAIAKSRLDIGSNIEVSGNYAVTDPGGRLSLGTNLFHSSVPPGSFLAADQMEFTTGASANNVLVNSLQLNGTANVRGTTSPVALPININLPPLPAGMVSSCTDGAANVTLAPSQTTTLAPGCYRNLQVRSNAILELDGGEYTFRQILIEADAQLIAKTATTLSVQQRLTTELRTFLSPQSGDAADLLIFLGGTQSRIGNESLFIGRIVAPYDPGFEFGVRVTFIGNAYAAGMNIFGVHLPRTPTPTPTGTPPPTPTPTEPFVPPTPTPTPTPPGPTPTPTPPGPTPTPTPPGQTPTPTPTATPFVPPTPTEPFVPPDECPSFTSPNNCD